MRVDVVRRMLGIAIAAGFIAVACGGDENTGAPATCSFGGQKCAFGCAPNEGCVDCLRDTDCPTAEPRCVVGRCRQCASNADCGTGQACFPDNYTCHTACTTNADCAGVGDSPLCKTATHQCVGCLSATDCPAERPICDANRAQCVECSSSANCGAAQPVCDLQNGECRECLVDSDCRAPALCGEDHHCHSVCKSNADCATADHPICDIPTGVCVECTANTQCPATAPFCNNNSCVVCVDNSNCPATLPVCGKDHTCVQCESDAQCTFDPALTKCRGQQCTAP